MRNVKRLGCVSESPFLVVRAVLFGGIDFAECSISSQVQRCSWSDCDTKKISQFPCSRRKLLYPSASIIRRVHCDQSPALRFLSLQLSLKSTCPRGAEFRFCCHLLSHEMGILRNSLIWLDENFIKYLAEYSAMLSGWSLMTLLQYSRKTLPKSSGIFNCSPSGNFKWTSLDKMYNGDEVRRYLVYWIHRLRRLVHLGNNSWGFWQPTLRYYPNNEFANFKVSIWSRLRQL